MERNVRSFNILDPLQAFQFATFLLRLKSQDVKIERLFDDHKDTFVDALVGGTCNKWTMEDHKSERTQTDQPPKTVPDSRPGFPTIAEEDTDGEAATISRRLEEFHLQKSDQPVHLNTKHSQPGTSQV